MKFTLAFVIVLLAACGSDSADNNGTGNNPQNPSGAGPAAVPLGAAGSSGSAGSYVVLAKTGISNVTGSRLTGDIGLSPAAASFITGFALIADSTNVFSTSSSVVGKVFAANYAVPSPTNLTTAIGSMESAYSDAAGRSNPDHLELGSGNIGGQTLAPGLYKWTSSVTVPSNVTIAGGASDVWIFQTSGDLTVAAGKSVTLSGGAQAKNIFWQVAGQSTLGATSHFEGVLLTKTGITLQTGATMNGRALAQTKVAIDQATITQPAQ
ncbi:MAG: ice-binding family protein [Myxococcales bacterium]